MIDLQIKINDGDRYKSICDGTVVRVECVLSTEVLIRPKGIPIADDRVHRSEYQWIRKNEFIRQYQLVDK